MKKLFFKLFLACLPILLLLAIFFIKDPFEVLYHRDVYYSVGNVIPMGLVRDFVTTENFINKYPHYKYDSYIFGNSRSSTYYVDEWEKHIGSKNCYHFDASLESLFGVERKFRLLQDKKRPIKNVLIILDESLCANAEGQKVPLFRSHPALSGESRLHHKLFYLLTFFERDFLTYQLSHLFHEDAKPLTPPVESYDDKTNEIKLVNFDTPIPNDTEAFYVESMDAFYKRDNSLRYTPQAIFEEQKHLFLNIKNIMDSNKTNYKIVISPLYDQFRFDTTDLKFLYSVFGKKNVFDFSGVNDFTRDFHNYYDHLHYRPGVANKIMDSIYKDTNTSPQ